MHRRCMPFVMFLLLALPAGTLRAQETLSRRDLNTLLRTAHTEGEYSRLEAYFHDQARQFHELEHSAKEQMDRALTVGSYSKYPSEYERARNLWMYYTQRGEQALASEKLYREKRKALHEGVEQPATP